MKLALFSFVLFNAVLFSQTAPDFTVRDINNKSVTLSQLTGNGPILINFWATWCAPCMAELPHLQLIYDELKSKGFTVLAISVDNSRTASKVKSFVNAKGFNFPVLLDTDNKVLQAYNPGGSVPYSIILDSEGKIVFSHSGYSPGDELLLRKKIEELIK
ncbi:MAG: TlpA family protein disulfide reductase [Ignavibacteriaceae bacterium]|nr:TlpA family protein disulfide reductase [Ignavibacteriaceae bacterium]